MIKAVIFDVDGVLIDSLNANIKFYQDLMVYIGVKPPTKEKLTSMFHMTMTDVIREISGAKSKDEVQKIWLQAKKKVVPYPSELITTPPNYGNVIETLADKYILAIVTSRIRGGVFMIPQMAIYEKYFKTTVYYEDTEKHKPNPEPLLLASTRLGLEPKETVYIGDMESDILAAKAAGMKSIVYSKKVVLGADKITANFEEIPKLVDSF